jgi:hypothetical protein
MKCIRFVTTVISFCCLNFSTLVFATTMTEEMESPEVSQVRETGVAAPVVGAIVLKGEKGPTQYFHRAKLLKCETVTKSANQISVQRGSCKNPQYVGINEEVNLEPGKYLVGYENSLYPGTVEIKAGLLTTIELQSIQAPQDAVEVRVYRDFSKLGEQRKQYFYTWGAGGTFFLQAEWDFGDFYLPKWPQRPSIPNLDYNYCTQKSPTLAEESVDICRAWKSSSFIELTDLFDFDSKGRFKQFWVGRPGGLFKFQNKRHLVGAPFKTNEFVSVLPGQYVVEFTGSDGKIKTTALSVGQIKANYGYVPTHSLVIQQAAAATIATMPENNPGIILPPVTEPQVLEGSTCETARLWKTEFRSYCRSDGSEGCSRASAKACVPMIDRQL